MGSEKEEVLSRLLVAHEANYDVYRDYAFGGRTFPGYAEFRSYGEQYVLVKRAKLWEVNAFEYIFFSIVEHFDKATYDEFVRWMTNEALDKVQLVPNHMSSYLSMVVIADEVDDDVRRAIRHERFHKSFKLGFAGYADLRIAVIDMAAEDVYVNNMGQDMKSPLKANLDVALKACREAEQGVTPAPAEQDVPETEGDVVMHKKEENGQ